MACLLGALPLQGVTTLAFDAFALLVAGDPLTHVLAALAGVVAVTAVVMATLLGDAALRVIAVTDAFAGTFGINPALLGLALLGLALLLVATLVGHAALCIVAALVLALLLFTALVALALGLVTALLGDAAVGFVATLLLALLLVTALFGLALGLLALAFARLHVEVFAALLLALAAGLVPVFVALLLLRARLAALLRACLFDTALHLFTALRLLRRALLLRTRRGLLAFAAGFATLGATFVALFLARLAVVVIVVRTLLGEGGCNATGRDQRTEYRGEAMVGGETGHLAFSEYGTNPSRRLGPVSDWANEWPLIFSSHTQARKRAFRNRRSGCTS